MIWFAFWESENPDNELTLAPSPHLVISVPTEARENESTIYIYIYIFLYILHFLNNSYHFHIKDFKFFSKIHSKTQMIEIAAEFRVFSSRSLPTGPLLLVCFRITPIKLHIIDMFFVFFFLMFFRLVEIINGARIWHQLSFTRVFQFLIWALKCQSMPKTLECFCVCLIGLWEFSCEQNRNFLCQYFCLLRELIILSKFDFYYYCIFILWVTRQLATNQSVSYY